MIEIDEDEEFLSQVAAAEAAALSSPTSASKRRRISAVVTPTSNSTTAANPSRISSTTLRKNTSTTTNLGGGAYIAALKGSKSLEFQKQAAIFSSSSSASRQSNKPYSSSNHINSSFPIPDSGDTCFKCGQSGHWSRDCDAVPITDESGPSSFPEKNCPCGLGNCIVLTANTEKNRGRKFYKCPIRQENGGCDFFEWCDKPSFTHSVAIQKNSATSFTNHELSCPCGAGPCLVLMAKTGKNIGQQFYRCPSQESCGFFKWCCEITSAAGSTVSQKASNNMYNNSNNSGTCFKCGKEGHWAKDCVQSPADGGGKSNGMSYKSHNSATCFKCGKEGHWAKDCALSFSLSSPADGGVNSTTTVTCFKCGKPGHWAKDCTSAVSRRQPRAM